MAVRKKRKTVQLTVGDVLRKKYPDETDRWDKWDYKIIAPVSLDDNAYIDVVLLAKNGDQWTCRLDLESAWSWQK
jgi:hypothetical protein